MGKYNYDYTKTMWMKMFLAEPDFPHDRSVVLINFEQALEIIRQVDNITQGVKKIVYLVGWQGMGHDDLYPDMDQINEALKRDCDETARDSLFWLFEAAKQYNTVVSFHVNQADAYEQSPCFPDLIKANAVANHADGTPAVIEVFNGRNAYKVSYKQYYDSGVFRRVWDNFCAATPVREAGTVHIDNFCIAESLNPETGMAAENEGRNHMLDYIASLGIDVTSEYTYRELDRRADDYSHPIHEFYGTDRSKLAHDRWVEAPIHALGRIAASWWMSNMTDEDYVNIPPTLYTGFPTREELRGVYYGNVHGEDIWKDIGIDPAVWGPEYIKRFCICQVPYYYLTRYLRMGLTEKNGAYTAQFSDGVESRGADQSIWKNGVCLKRGEEFSLLPFNDEKTLFVAYSSTGRSGEWDIPDAPDGTAKVYEITTAGNRLLGDAEIRDGKIGLTVAPGQGLAIRL